MDSILRTQSIVLWCGAGTLLIISLSSSLYQEGKSGRAGGRWVDIVRILGPAKYRIGEGSYNAKLGSWLVG